MIREYGFSSSLGPVAYPPLASTYLEGYATDHPYAEATQRLIDAEVSQLLRDARQRAIELLRQHRPALDELTRRLIAEETLDGSVVYHVIRRQAASGEPDAGVEHRVHGVDHDVRDHDEERGHQDDADDHRKILSRHRLDGELA